jgi:hypothetical protein
MSQLSVASAILEKTPEPISKLQPLTPPVLDRAVAECLAKSPEERFQSAHDVGLVRTPVNRVSRVSATAIKSASNINSPAPSSARSSVLCSEVLKHPDAALPRRRLERQVLAIGRGQRVNHKSAMVVL